MGHDPSSPGIESQGQRSEGKVKVKVNAAGGISILHQGQFSSLACSAKLPTGLYILLSLISFFYSEQS